MARASAAATSSPLKLYLLGSLRIECGEQTVHLSTRKAESLLAYLALHPETHSREKLAALFWGDSSDEQARTSLRTALAVIRRQLGEQILRADRETAQLDPAYPHSVDALEFTNALELESARSRQSELVKLQAAIELYQGDLLSDFYDDWIFPERENFRARYIDALLLLIQRLRARSEYDSVIAYAQKVLAVDRANELAYQHLMFCCHAIGDRSAALKQFDECKRVLADELGADPSPETLALYESIKQADALPETRPAHLTNLPVPVTSFIGRKQEMAEVKRLLLSTRLLTLTGPGGIGKTRLAKEAAFDLVHAFKDGVWIVELGELMDASRVAQTIAKTLGIRDTSNQPFDQIITVALASRAVLLILDNCEHLIEACAQIVEMLLGHCPDLKILATSREALDIPGETVWQVPGLGLPDWEETNRAVEERLAALRQYDAVRLFADRAAASATAFQLTNYNAYAVAQVCQRLDGIPLAIELAAARVKALTVEQIAARLDDRFRLLTGGSRTALPRYQTLRSLIDWSYDLLAEPERALFRRLAVFAGGWTLEAAEAVCCCEKIESIRILELEARLVDKSLVLMEEHDGGTRYRFLETIRQYARDKLLESEEAARTRDRHRDWFLALAEEAEIGLRTGEQLFWLNHLETEHDNLRAALEWSLGRSESSADDAEKGLRIAGALAQFWAMHGHLGEGRRWMAHALRSPTGSIPPRAKALTGEGVLAYLQSDLPRAAELCEQGLALARQTDDKWFIGVSLFVLGEYHRNYRHDLPRAQSLLSESLTLARQVNDPWLKALTLYGFGLQSHLQGDQKKATNFLEESLELCRSIGDKWLCAAVLNYLGDQAHTLADYNRAAELYGEALTLRQALKDKGGIAGSLNNLGDIARHLEDYARAEALYESSLALFREVGQKESIAIVLDNLGFVAIHQANLGKARALFAEGLALFRGIGNQAGIAECLTGFASIAVTNKQFERAARLHGATAALLEAIGAHLPPADLAECARDSATARRELGELAFAAAFGEGRALSLDQAVEYATKESTA